MRMVINGFDNEADFIPFDFSDEENANDNTKPEALVPDGRTPLPQPELKTLSQMRGRKRASSSPERGPPTQRQKLRRVDINPWQQSIDAYSSLKETSRMYIGGFRSLISRLHQEVLDFSNWISPTEREHEIRSFVVKRVVDTIEKAFPECRVHPFGSFETKLYVPDAYVSLSFISDSRDIDIVVDWPGYTWSKSSMRSIGRALERRGVGTEFEYVFTAKVPLYSLCAHCRFPSSNSWKHTLE